MSNTTPFIDIAERGINAAAFDEYLKDFVTTEIHSNKVTQVGTVDGVKYQLTIRLTRWTGRTSPEQIVILSRLFWQCYPKMYKRFAEVGESPTQVTLDIENRGYGIAWASGKLVHLHDGWLEGYHDDYDCITHELAHVIQNGWEGDKCEYSNFIEIFANVCRYLYAFNDGEYNDHHWQLQTVMSETTRESAVRFPVWFDYFYSTPENDLLVNYFRVCRECKYPSENWKEAWQEIFKGSALEGRDIEDIYEEYSTSEFAKLSSRRVDGKSPLLEKFDIRRYTL